MKEFITNLKFTWKYAKEQKKVFIQYILLEMVAVAISIVVPILSAKIIIQLTENNFYQLLLIAVVIYLTENIRNFINNFKSRRYQYFFRGTLINMQTAVSKEILKLENKILDEKGTGVFIQRITNDSSKISESIAVFSMRASELLANIGIFTAILIINKLAFIFVIIVSIITYITDKYKMKDLNDLDKSMRKTQEKATSFISESIRGCRDVKMLNAEENFMKRMELLIKDVNETRYNFANTRRFYTLIKGFIFDTADLLNIILLVYLIQNNFIAVAEALVIHNYASRVRNFSGNFELLLEDIRDFNLSASRVRDIMDSEEFEKEKFGKLHIKRVHGNFEFKNVNFAYKDNQVLNNISFKIKANETVAFVGKSGVGKTTIFNLLCKMYDNYEGTITIDNHDIKELDKDSIRGNITIISQDPYIFNLSIKDNLKLVKSNATNKEIENALKLSCLDEFVNSLPEKCDTIIGEGGVNLSGGQKQRLAIARALIQNTEIILFDEATSALDNETQYYIQKAIDNMQTKYTILIIAHRLSTIKNCDRIIFLEDGKILDSGSHSQLLKRCKSYKELYETELEKG